MNAVEINGITGVEAATRRIETQNDCHERQDKANARLIAATPELLDAAKAVLQIWDDLYYNQSDPEEREAWNTLRAAIAKAEGGAE